MIVEYELDPAGDVREDVEDEQEDEDEGAVAGHTGTGDLEQSSLLGYMSSLMVSCRLYLAI